MVKQTKAVLILDQIVHIAVALAIMSYIFSRGLLLVGIYTALIAWLLGRILKRKTMLPHTEWNIYLGIILTALIASVIVNGNWYEGARGLHKWLRALLLFLFAADYLRDKESKKNVLLALGTAFLVAVLDGIAQYFTGRDWIRGFELGYADFVPRVTSSFGYFGMFASFLVMAGPIVFWFFWKNSSKLIRYGLLGISMSLGLLNLYLTRARGAWISLAAMFVAYLVITKRWVMITVLAVATAAFLFLLPRDIVLHSPKEVGIDKTIHHRIILSNEALTIWRANPLFGCGLNTYVQNVEKYNLPNSHEVRNYYAHNGYLQYGAETGIVGFLALVFFLFRYGMVAIYKCITERAARFSLNHALLVSNGSFLFYMFFDTIFHNLQPFLLFWFLLGWHASVLRYSHENITS